MRRASRAVHMHNFNGEVLVMSSSTDETRLAKAQQLVSRIAEMSDVEDYRRELEKNWTAVGPAELEPGRLNNGHRKIVSVLDVSPLARNALIATAAGMIVLGGIAWPILIPASILPGAWGLSALFHQSSNGHKPSAK